MNFAMDLPVKAYLPRIVALEDEFLDEYDRTREAARELLRSGKRAEAVKLLNDGFAHQFAAAEKLLDECRRQIIAIAAEDKNIEQVYRLNLQLFPLSKEVANNKED